MGNSEAETPAKPEKPSPERPSSERPSSPLPLEQPNVHVYSDWAAVQAYYGAGVALPPPYFGSAVPPGHPSHPYMWGPQPMMPPYGSPYAAMYPHGGMYAHPSLSLGAHGHGVQPSPVVASPLGIATPSKSTSTKDKGSKKRLKGSDGLAVSRGNGNDGSAAGLESEEDGVEGSSDGSDGNTEAGGDPVQRKRSRDATLPSGMERKVDRQGISLPILEAKTASNKSQGSSGAPEVAGMVPLRNPPGLELLAPSTGKRRATAPDAAMPVRDGLPPEVWMKDERALKREKRKQSNRESARRSRLRKQAESEELALKVESLNTENLALRSEINRLTENSENLKIENAMLMEKLKNAGHSDEMASDVAGEQSPTPISTENFLSRVDNSDSASLTQHLETSVQENPNSGAKLHQLLKSSPRADAVAAG